MEYKFSGQITYDDFMQFQQFNLKSVLKSTFGRNRFFALLAIVLAYTLYNFRKGHFPETITILVLIAGIILTVFLILYHSKGLYLKSFFNDVSNSRNCEYTINENYINIQFDDSLIHLEKNAIHNILFDDDSIYIYQAPKRAKIIKKRFFDNEANFKNVLSFIEKEYINQPADV